MTTFALRWLRQGQGRVTVGPNVPLATGLMRLRKNPVSCWTRGPLAVWHFSEDPVLSLFEDPSGRIVIVVGRLDAFDDLVHLAGGARSLGGSPSDAQVLAAVMHRWGEGGLDRLIGDFIAIVWDPRERSLLCARDRVGVAPMYYWESPDEVVVSGHIGGVLAHDLVQATPNDHYVAEALAVTFESLTDTLYKDVRRLPAGHARLFESTGSRSWRWAPEYPVDPDRLSSAEAQERYRELLTLAIRDRARGAGRIGTELSGGLDSSTVAALAAPLVSHRPGEGLRSYSLVFPGLECDETPYIREVAEYCGLTPTLVPAATPPPDFWRHEQATTRDLPLAPNLVAWRSIRSAARDDGLSTMLTGMGGDQGFDSTSMAVVGPLLGLRFREAGQAARTLYPDLSAGLRLTQSLRPALANRVRTHFPGFRPQPAPEWIDSRFARETGLHDRHRHPPAPPSSARDERLGLYRSGWESYVFEANSLFGLMTGLASSHPFYDARVIAFALALEERHRWANRQGRAIQRRSMIGRLPGAVVERRSKAEFSHLFVEELRRAGGRSAFDGLLIARECGWVQPDELVRMYDAMEEGVRAGSGPSWVWPLWMVLAVERWFSCLTGTC